MGNPTSRKARAASKKKQYKRSHSTKCRARDVDQIQVRHGQAKAERRL